MEIQDIKFEIVWSDKTNNITCYAKDSLDIELCKCVIGISTEKSSWTISSWFTNRSCQHQGIGKATMKEILNHCVSLYGSPKDILYIWNGAHQYVMDWLIKEFDAVCTCPIAVQKKLEGKDVWESHIYKLNKEKLFKYFNIKKD